MKIVYPHEGQALLLNILFGSVAVITPLYLILYKNDYTPTVDSEAGSDFTACDHTGYATKELARGSWTITQWGGSIPVYTTYAEQEFTCSSTPSPAEYAYGYLLAYSSGGIWYAVAAARFDVPVLILSGSTITVQPVLALDDWAGA